MFPIAQNLPYICAGQDKTLQKYGLLIWDHICATRTGRRFSARSLTEEVANLLKIKYGTAYKYTLLTLHNVVSAPGNPPCLERTGNSWHLPIVNYKELQQ